MFPLPMGGTDGSLEGRRKEKAIFFLLLAVLQAAATKVEWGDLRSLIRQSATNSSSRTAVNGSGSGESGAGLFQLLSTSGGKESDVPARQRIWWHSPLWHGEHELCVTLFPLFSSRLPAVTNLCASPPTSSVTPVPFNL